jgi:hypothetical protein
LAGTFSWFTGSPPILTIRPRSDGTLSSLPAPGTASIVFSKSAICELWTSTKKKPGASLGDALGDLLLQIALDQGGRHQHGETESQRQHDDRRRRAGPMEIGERQPQGGKLGLADPRRRPHQAARQQRKGDEGADRTQHEPAAVRRSGAT